VCVKEAPRIGQKHPLKGVSPPPGYPPQKKLAKVGRNITPLFPPQIHGVQIFKPLKKMGEPVNTSLPLGSF